MLAHTILHISRSVLCPLRAGTLILCYCVKLCRRIQFEFYDFGNNWWLLSLWSVFNSVFAVRIHSGYFIPAFPTLSSDAVFITFSFLSPGWEGLSPKVLFKGKWTCCSLWAILEHSRARFRRQNRGAGEGAPGVLQSEARQAWQGEHLRATSTEVKRKYNCSNSLPRWERKFFIC